MKTVRFRESWPQWFARLEFLIVYLIENQRCEKIFTLGPPEIQPKCLYLYHQAEEVSNKTMAGLELLLLYLIELVLVLVFDVFPLL